MRGTKARTIRRIALNYSIINAKTIGRGVLGNTRHKNTPNDRPSFAKYGGYPRVYRDMKKSYTEGSLKL